MVFAVVLLNRESGLEMISWAREEIVVLKLGIPAAPAAAAVVVETWVLGITVMFVDRLE